MNQSYLYENALYLHLLREGDTGNFPYATPSVLDYRCLSNSDKAIAEFMTEREEEMYDLPHYWNEDGYIDFESAFAMLVEIADNIRKRIPKNAIVNFKEYLNDGVRWCSYCGKPMNEGFYLTDFYACSKECRNKHYKQDYGAKDDEEAEKMYLLDCYELAGDKYPNLCTGSFLNINYIREQTGKHPQDLSLKELNDIIEDSSFEIGDYAYYTNWN